MKIIILTQYYPPEHGAPQNRLHDLARRWVKKGHSVTVLTAMPNYPRGAVFPEYRWKLIAQEEIDGVNVIRSFIFASKIKSTFIQLTVYFSFVISSLLVGLFKLKRADFLICESPPLFLGFTAIILSWLKRIRLIMNISDLWPESAVQLGMLNPGPILTMLEAFERRLYVNSCLVTCQTEGIVKGVIHRYPEASTFLFPNGVDLEMFPVITSNPQLAEELEIDPNKFIVGYGGNHGRAQGLSQVLDAAEIVQNKYKKESILFTLFGNGPEKEELIKLAQTKKLDNVRFFPSQPREKMAEIQSLWDIALVPLKNLKIFNGARPSKMFELMAGQIPFIFCGCGEGAVIAEKSGCGDTVAPEEPEILAERIVKFSQIPKETLLKMGMKGREFVSTNFNRCELADKLLERLMELASNN